MLRGTPAPFYYTERPEEPNLKRFVFLPYQVQCGTDLVFKRPDGTNDVDKVRDGGNRR